MNWVVWIFLGIIVASIFIIRLNPIDENFDNYDFRQKIYLNERPQHRFVYIPFWLLTHQNRMRNDYGSIRYGRRYGYGWDPTYLQRRY